MNESILNVLYVGLVLLACVVLSGFLQESDLTLWWKIAGTAGIIAGFWIVATAFDSMISP
jgi:hypothetical protein